MKKLAVSLVSLGLLLSSFSAVSATEYRCDLVAMDIKEERIVIDAKKVTRVIVSRDKILFGFIDDKLSSCSIRIREGDYIGNEIKDCFFNIKEKQFMTANSNYLISYENCREVTYK